MMDVIASLEWKASSGQTQSGTADGVGKADGVQLSMYFLSGGTDFWPRKGTRRHKKGEEVGMFEDGTDFFGHEKARRCTKT
jgi:hypothetical protein